MGLNETVSSERVHIGFFGLRNAGKSSVVNAVTGQSFALVSDLKGPTTDPVQKAMELLPLGPVVITDPPGIDDEGELGEMRVKKAYEILGKTDVALLVVDATVGKTQIDRELITSFENRKIPYIVVYNKSDLLKNPIETADNEILVSAMTGAGIFELKEKVGALSKSAEKKKYIVADLLDVGDIVVLCVPIDESAPKGRLILPQQLTIRDILDNNSVCICTQPSELKATLDSLKEKPKMVITDSQVFATVSEIVPEDIKLTSFSILMARYKGDLEALTEGAKALSEIADNDKILISEGCTHHRQCNDIGSVKIPNMIRKFTGKNPVFEFTSGGEFPEDLSAYKLVVHCGGCMLNDKEMNRRIDEAKNQRVPVVNYGVLIANITGILRRSLEIFET